MFLGLGFMLGLQVLVSLVITGVALPTITLGFMVGAFFVGGFVIGWMNEDFRLGDSLITTVIALALVAVADALLPEATGSRLDPGWSMKPASSA